MGQGINPRSPGLGFNRQWTNECHCLERPGYAGLAGRQLPQGLGRSIADSVFGVVERPTLRFMAFQSRAKACS